MAHDDLAKQVQRHDIEIDTIKSVLSEVGDQLKDNTKSNRDLIQHLTIYTTKHDGLEERMKDMQITQAETLKTQGEHGEKIAQMMPTVESLRGLIWKMVGAVLLASGGAASIVAVVVKGGL